MNFNLECFLKDFRDIFVKLIMFIFALFPIEKNKVVFKSFRGTAYNDNPRAIFLEMKKRFPDIKYIWLMKDSCLKIEGACVIQSNSLREIYHIATAKIWVDDVRKGLWCRKRNEQYYIQTWHGDICLKRIEKDAEESLPTRYIRQAKNDSKMIDLLLSGSTWRTNLYRNAFWYKGEILECSLPKEDVFYCDPKPIVEQVRTFYNLSPDLQIVIYAPTFRSNHSLDIYNLNYERLLKNLKRRFGGQWVLLVRLHPNIANKNELISYSDSVLNGTAYPDISELIVASQLLITDYSGCMFEAMKAGKKVLLYASDLKSYEKDRGMYFSLSNLPFPIAKNNDQLEENILQFNENTHIIEKKKFLRRYGCYSGGGGAELLANYIRDIIIGG